MPQVISFNDWLEAAPGAWKFPRKHSDLERWLSVYATLKKHRKLQAWFKAESDSGAWGLAQAIINACDTLSSSVAPRLQAELSAIIKNPGKKQLQDMTVGQEWIEKLEPLLEATIAQAYPVLARKVLDQEAQVLLTFWRYISGASDPAFRKQFAMAAHLEQAKRSAEHQHLRPLIWIETADPSPIEKEIIQTFLQDYAQFSPVVEASMDWQTVGLWAEAIHKNSGEAVEASEKQASLNMQKANPKHWHLIAAKRFEELAWVAAKTIEQHLIDGKTNIALVAQDRLVSRRARALLARLGPSLKVQDETGWKLSTTRAAAALNSWLELIRSPKEGPTASNFLEFLHNPFLDLEKCLGKNQQACSSLIAQLEDFLVASQAQSGWETFYMAIEYAGHNASMKGGDRPNPALLELLQFFRAKHHAWLDLRVDCSKAYEQLQADLNAMGMSERLANDLAGKQLLEVLCTFDLRKTEHHQISMGLAEWLSLLKTVIEEASFQELGKAAIATLSILPLSATRLREFEAVVIVGCDEQQLPAFSEPPLFFSDALNQLLKASTIQAQFTQQARDLSQLFSSCANVDLLWQSKSKNGEPLRSSAWIGRLQAQMHWEVEGIRMTTRSATAKPMHMTTAKLMPDFPMPASMSPSAYKALRDCPYRYYVKSLLGLRKFKGFDEGFDASLAGQTLHAILRDFYRSLKTEEHLNPQLKSDTGVRREWMKRQLNFLSEKEFKRLVEGDARVLGTLRDWQKQIPSFVEWQLQRDEQGWQYFDGEVKVGFNLDFTDSQGTAQKIRIEGYTDRFDIQTENSSTAAVLDYKNQRFERVKQRAEHVLDDPQLLIYARAANEAEENHKLAGRQVQQAEWVALKANLSKGNEQVVRAKEVAEMPAMMNAFSEQITHDVEQLWSKKPMKAFAPDGVCQY